MLGFNVCARMYLMNMMFQRMLKCSLGTTKIKSIGIANAYADESFKDFTIKQKNAHEGYHARVLYKLDIDLNYTSDLIKDKYDEAKDYVSNWLTNNHYADKLVFSFNTTTNTIMIYIALFCIYKHINEISGHEKLNTITMNSKITEADFITSNDIKNWIQTSAPGCEFITREKPEYLDMFYVSFYLFKFIFFIII